MPAVRIVAPEKMALLDMGMQVSPDNYDALAACVEYYFAGYRNGEQLWEIDKRNQKFVVMDVDYRADVRKALGEWPPKPCVERVSKRKPPVIRGVSF